MDMNLSKFRETVKDREALCAAGHKELDIDLVTEQQQQFIINILVVKIHMN